MTAVCDDTSSVSSAPPRTPSVKEVLNWADDYSSNDEEWVPEPPSCCPEAPSCCPEPPSCCVRAVGSDMLDAAECCELPFCLAVEVDLNTGAPPEGAVGRTYCEGVHSFKPFKARDGHYKCGGCGSPVPTDTEMLGCTECTFDICLKCMDDYSGENFELASPAPSAPPEIVAAAAAPISANPLMNLPLPTCPIQSIPPVVPYHTAPDYAIHPAPNVHLPPPTSYGHRRRNHTRKHTANSAPQVVPLG